jgi:hypothetical protein
MPQWLIALGSIVGLLTGIYTLWERFIKQRPNVWLSQGSHRGELVLRVKNPGDQDIALIGFSVTPRVYAVANSAHFDSLVDAILDDSSFRLVRAGQEAELPLKTMQEDGKELDSEVRHVFVRLFWRRTGSMWCPRVPLWLAVSTLDVLRLKVAEVNDQ